jgi:purine catabolism regulator
VPFLAVTRTVARLVQDEEQQALRAALTVQQQLTRDAASPDGTDAILRRLARAVAGEAVVCDPDGVVLARDRGRTSPRRAGEDVLPAVRQVIARLRPEGLRASHTDIGPRGSTLVQPLGLTGTPHSYLVLSATARWDASAHTAVATAAALLSLQGERRADALATAREIRGAGLALLLDGQLDPARALLALPAADAVSLDSERAFHVLLAHVTSDPGDTLAALERWTGEEPTTRLVAIPPAGDGQPVILLAAGTDPADAVAALGPGARAGIGAARPLAALAASAATARAALDRTTADRPVARWDDVVDDGLTALLDGVEAEAFARSVLGPLTAPSAENSELLATLDAFHRHHGQLTVIADTLGVHRNTVRRRLRRVEQLTGRSPDSPRGRVELWVAAEILRREGPPGR